MTKYKYLVIVFTQTNRIFTTWWAESPSEAMKLGVAGMNPGVDFNSVLVAEYDTEEIVVQHEVDGPGWFWSVQNVPTLLPSTL